MYLDTCGTSKFICTFVGTTIWLQYSYTTAVHVLQCYIIMWLCSEWLLYPLYFPLCCDRVFLQLTSLVRIHVWVCSLCDRNGPLAVVGVQGKVWLLVQYLLIAVVLVPAVVIALVVVAVLQNVVVFQP